MKRMLLALLLATSAFAQKDPLSRSWNQPVEPFRIAGNLYYVGASEITSFLITTPQGHVVIDGGFEETAPMILANIRRLGFRVEDVRILLNSHAHLDHAGGLAALKKATGARFIATRADASLLARGGLDDPQFADRLPFPPIHPDRIIDDEGRVTIGGTTLIARITPGHSPGCTTWTTVVNDHGKRRSVVFVGSASVPSTYNLTTNRRYPHAAEDYRRTFAILRSLHPDIFLGSHGNFFSLEEKIRSRKFVDPSGYVAYVERSERAFEKHLAVEAERATSSSTAVTP
jgi:metallo-beta-lactamase class B